MDCKENFQGISVQLLNSSKFSTCRQRGARITISAMTDLIMPLNSGIRTRWWMHRVVFSVHSASLWSPYVMGQTIYIFILFLSFFFFFYFLA